MTHYLSLNPQTFSEGDWVFVHPQKTLGRIIEKSCLWGNTSFRVWLPSSNSIIRVDASALSPAQSSVLSPDDFYDLDGQEQLDQKAHAYPKMVPLLVIRVEGNRE